MFIFPSITSSEILDTFETKQNQLFSFKTYLDNALIKKHVSGKEKKLRILSQGFKTQLLILIKKLKEYSLLENNLSLIYAFIIQAFFFISNIKSTPI